MIFILTESLQYPDKDCLSNRNSGGLFLKLIFLNLRLSFYNYYEGK